MYLSVGSALVGLFALFSTASAVSTPVNNANVTSTFSTSITGTRTSAPLPNPLEKRGPGPSNLACYNLQKGCKNKEIREEDVTLYARDICNQKGFKGVVVGPDWEGVAGSRVNPYWPTYHIKIEWKPGCTVPGKGTMKIDQPAPGVTCHDLAFNTWKNCKHNAGRGGKIDFGCLEYHYNTINGDKNGPDHCHDVPFGNYTG